MTNTISVLGETGELTNVNCAAIVPVGIYLTSVREAYYLLIQI
jgi:hypothetical protein